MKKANGIEAKLLPKQKDIYPIYQGRWQPFHLGHYFIAKKLYHEYGRVVLGIIVPDPLSYPEKYERFHPAINPFTYWERYEMIIKSFELDGLPTIGKVFVVPGWGLGTGLVREKPFLPVEAQRLFVMPIAREESFIRMDFYRQINANLIVFENIPRRLSGIEGAMIRDRILKGGKWMHLVPKGTAEVIKKYNLARRVKEATGRRW